MEPAKRLQVNAEREGSLLCMYTEQLLGGANDERQRKHDSVCGCSEIRIQVHGEGDVGREAEERRLSFPASTLFRSSSDHVVTM